MDIQIGLRTFEKLEWSPGSELTDFTACTISVSGRLQYFNNENTRHRP